MLDTKVIFRNLLINNAAVIALVPAVRILGTWPNESTVKPCIVFREIDNSLSNEDYLDDSAKSESSIMQLDIFNTASCFNIAKSVDDVLSINGWNRDYAEDFVEEDTRLIHKVMRYSKRTFY